MTPLKQANIQCVFVVPYEPWGVDVWAGIHFQTMMTLERTLKCDHAVAAIKLLFLHVGISTGNWFAFYIEVDSHMSARIQMWTCTCECVWHQRQSTHTKNIFIASIRAVSRWHVSHVGGRSSNIKKTCFYRCELDMVSAKPSNAYSGLKSPK